MYSSLRALLLENKRITISTRIEAAKIENPIAYRTEFFASPPSSSTQRFDLFLSESVQTGEVALINKHCGLNVPLFSSNL